MSTHLVAGGSGYFGSALVEELRGQGFRVKIFDLNENTDRPRDVEFVRGDIRSPADIERALCDVEVIYNAVAQVPLIKDKKLFSAVNVRGTRNLLQAALKRKIKKVVHISSSAIFGIPKNNPVDEKTVPRPLEPYGQAKLEGEHVVEEFTAQGLDTTIIRPRTILGCNRLGIFSILFDWVYQGANIPVLGKGHNRYQFIHARDLAKACVLAAGRQGAALYNIGAEEFGTMRELLEDLIRHARTKSNVRSLPFGLSVFLMRLTGMTGLTPFAPYHWLMYGRELFFDITKAKTELKWRPQYSNSEMIRESYDAFCRNYDSLQNDSHKSVHQKIVEQGMLKFFKKII